VGQNREPSAVGQRYRIVVRGEFGELLTAAFRDVSVTAGGGKTELVATVRDSQELYGLLDRLRDHGIHIEEVSEIDGRD
jgi:hypothetical protein